MMNWSQSISIYSWRDVHNSRINKSWFTKELYTRQSRTTAVSKKSPQSMIEIKLYLLLLLSGCMAWRVHSIIIDFQSSARIVHYKISFW